MTYTRRPLDAWADLLYKPHGHVAHIVPFGQQYSLCGAMPLGFVWHGTGSMDEYERAEALPLCGVCEVQSA